MEPRRAADLGRGIDAGISKGRSDKGNARVLDAEVTAEGGSKNVELQFTELINTGKMPPVALGGSLEVTPYFLREELQEQQLRRPIRIHEADILLL
jgi:hypothetical protein